ncbi:MAG: histidine phosphatase family protein [Litoreibacter sp.]|nr:histidine phosphatase family protein [Litoreibacter sp.]
MRWVWVRHGPTHAKAMVGWTDLPADLSDTAQIARLQAHLPDAPILSSDLSRTRATADAIQQGRLRLPDTAALREIHFGDWENRGFAEVEAEDPDRIRAYWEQPGDVAPPSGESWNAIAARVNNFVDGLTAQAPYETIIAVAHMGVILTQVQRALGISAYDTLAQKIGNFSVTEIRWDGSKWQADVINHLP